MQESSSSQIIQTYPFVFGASVIGPLHIIKGLPCQDSCGYEAIGLDSAIVTLADGLGSAEKSDIGAEIAVKAVVKNIKEFLSSEINQEHNLNELAINAIKYARSELEVKAHMEKCDLRDLACTIIVAIINRNELSVAHIGDGAVVGKIEGQIRIISPPGESEYINEVVPITCESWQENMRINSVISGIESIALFTDGCQRAALAKTQEGLIPYRGFFEPLFSYAGEINNVGQGILDIKGLLSSKKMSDSSEDDKTLIIAKIK